MEIEVTVRSVGDMLLSLESLKCSEKIKTLADNMASRYYFEPSTRLEDKLYGKYIYYYKGAKGYKSEKIRTLLEEHRSTYLKKVEVKDCELRNILKYIDKASENNPDLWWSLQSDMKLLGALFDQIC